MHRSSGHLRRGLWRLNKLAGETPALKASPLDIFAGEAPALQSSPLDTGGHPAKRGGISIIALLIVTATGFKSEA